MSDVAILQGRDPKVDAWRGLSIAMVVAGHLLVFHFAASLRQTPFRDLHGAGAAALAKNAALRITDSLPGLGVCVFFVISGYVITSTLQREEARRRSVSFAAFYIRRVFRIIPPFAAVLLTLAALSALGLIVVAPRDLVGAGLFLCDTAYGCRNWWIGHTWSLAVEEQFYLVWPLAFALTAKGARPMRLAILYVALIALSYAPWSTRIWSDQGILGLAFPCIVLGALFACAPAARRLVERRVNDAIVVAAAAALVTQPLFASAPLLIDLERPFAPLLIAIVFFGSMREGSRFSRLLTQRWLVWLGLISYSLYLWQQLFTGDPVYDPASRFFPLCLPAAAASYYLIERPMIAVGRRLSSRFTHLAAEPAALNPRPELAVAPPPAFEEP